MSARQRCAACKMLRPALSPVPASCALSPDGHLWQLWPPVPFGGEWVTLPCDDVPPEAEHRDPLAALWRSFTEPPAWRDAFGLRLEAACRAVFILACIALWAAMLAYGVSRMR